MVISEGRLQTVSGVMKLYGHILAGVWLGAWKKCYGAAVLWQRGWSVLVIKKYVNRPMSASSLIRAAVHPPYEGVFDTEGDPAKIKYEANGVLLILADLPSSLVGSSRFYALVTLSAKSPESH